MVKPLLDPHGHRAPQNPGNERRYKELRYVGASMSMDQALQIMRAKVIPCLVDDGDS